MRIPSFFDVRDRPLLTDDDVLDRVAAIVGRPRRRQLWLMFLDEDGHQLPLLVPLELPRRGPHPHEAAVIAGALARAVEAVDPSELVLAFERGRWARDAALQPTEGAWLALTMSLVRRLEVCRLGEDCPADGSRHGDPLAVRGPVLVTRSGPRWIAPDDLIADLDLFERMF